MADVPGISVDRIKITVKENKICIEGKRKRKVISDSDNYLIAERTSGPFKKMIEVFSFFRSVSFEKVPFDCDAENMKAKIENGILVLTMMKVESSKVGKVVKVEGVSEEIKEPLV